MNHIIVDFQPFTLKQNVLVYVDGECVKQTAVEVDQITDVVTGLSKQYNIKQIDLCGNENYLFKFKANMRNKFENSDYEINIIQR